MSSVNGSVNATFWDPQRHAASTHNPAFLVLGPKYGRNLLHHRPARSHISKPHCPHIQPDSVPLALTILSSSRFDPNRDKTFCTTGGGPCFSPLGLGAMLKLPSDVVDISSSALSNTRRMGMDAVRARSHSTCARNTSAKTRRVKGMEWLGQGGRWERGWTRCAHAATRPARATQAQNKACEGNGMVGARG
eukprot:366549-Chlamydomonas_euryale.AAC.5